MIIGLDLTQFRTSDLSRVFTYVTSYSCVDATTTAYLGTPYLGTHAGSLAESRGSFVAMDLRIYSRTKFSRSTNLRVNSETEQQRHRWQPDGCLMSASRYCCDLVGWACGCIWCRFACGWTGADQPAPPELQREDAPVVVAQPVPVAAPAPAPAASSAAALKARRRHTQRTLGKA